MKKIITILDGTEHETQDVFFFSLYRVISSAALIVLFFRILHVISPGLMTLLEDPGSLLVARKGPGASLEIVKAGVDTALASSKQLAEWSIYVLGALFGYLALRKVKLKLVLGPIDIFLLVIAGCFLGFSVLVYMQYSEMVLIAYELASAPNKELPENLVGLSNVYYGVQKVLFSVGILGVLWAILNSITRHTAKRD